MKLDKDRISYEQYKHISYHVFDADIITNMIPWNTITSPSLNHNYLDFYHGVLLLILDKKEQLS